MTGSLAYRKNERAILTGNVPDKYTRLLPHIPMGRILELGSAEGVLALLLARRGDKVTALEKSRERHDNALRLCQEWSRFHKFDPPEFLCGNITERFDLLESAETLVAVRMIYYLRDRLDDVFAEVSAMIPNVVLCGNKQRAAWWKGGVPDKEGGPLNEYASAEGITALLTRHGYRIAESVTEGDPIIVGRK